MPAIATYRPSYAPRPSVRAITRPVKVAKKSQPTSSAKEAQAITESRAYDLLFERGLIAANLSGPDLQTVRNVGACLFFKWQDRKTVPTGLPTILQTMAAEIESRQQEIREYRRKLNLQLEYEENHLA